MVVVEADDVVDVVDVEAVLDPAEVVVLVEVDGAAVEAVVVVLEGIVPQSTLAGQSQNP